MSSHPSVLVVAPRRLALGLYSTLAAVVTNVVVLVWDGGLAIYNVIAPNRHPERVVPAGYIGENGVWPPYVAPEEGDSRCSCPALNAMANHGLLPHSGRGIKFKEMGDKIRTTYNFAPSFCFFVPKYSADMLCRDYWKDTFDLSDLDAHNCIEHDASLTREDSYHQRDQGKPAVHLVEELLASGTGPNGDLTCADLARISTKRRAEAKRANPQFSLSTFSKMFGSSNSSTMLTIMGGKIKDLRSFLLEERIPDGWQPRIRHPMGLTMAEFNATVLRVELGIAEDILEGDVGGSSQKKRS